MRLNELIALLVRFPAKRIPLEALLPDANHLGTAFSAGDSFYVALARKIDGELWTRDAPLARGCDGVCGARLI